MTQSRKNTLVLGASANPSRYSYLAINKLRAHGHPVIAVGKRNAQVNDVEISKEQVTNQDIDTVTLYLNAANQRSYYDYILSLKPRRIIFNPGTENPELEDLARKNGIKTLEACTLVMLGSGQY